MDSQHLSLKKCNFDIVIECKQLPSAIKRLMLDVPILTLKKSQVLREIQFQKERKIIDDLQLPKKLKRVMKQLPGRQEQLLRIYNFIKLAKNGSQRPICLHGNTGCGKTTTVNKIIEFLQQDSKTYLISFINCMSLLSSKAIYSLILNRFFQMSDRKPQVKLDNLFKRQDPISPRQIEILNKPKILILDQVDMLIKDKNFLYNILQWIHLPKTNMLLIFISNTIDLQNYMDSKTLSRYRPDTVIFKPYNFLQLVQIFKYKCPNYKEYFEDSAAMFLCRKVANVNSDVRVLESILNRLLKELPSGEKIKVAVVNKALWRNKQIKKILAPHSQVIKCLCKATYGTNIPYQVNQIRYLNSKPNITTDCLMNSLIQLRDMGLISLENVMHNKKQIIFGVFAINVSDQLRILEDDFDDNGNLGASYQ